MASNNKLMQEISDQFLNCKICLETYKDPKTLSCLHTFCTECIQQHIDSENSRSRFSLYNRHVTCPLCRKRTELPTGGVRRLPENFLLANLTEVIDRRRPSKIPPCEICLTLRPRSNEASSKCLDCSKFLCKSCVNLHMTTKVTQNHSLIDVEGEKDIECKVHPEESVRFYCEPCDTCICVVCTFQDHRDHEICSFSDGYVKYKTSMESLLEQCKSRQDIVQERLHSLNQCESVLKETRESIRDLAISYIQQVRSTEKKLLQEVDSYFGENALELLDQKDWLQENLEGLQSACNLADIIMRDRGVEMLLLKKDMQSKLNLLLEPDIPDLPGSVVKPIQFVPGDVKFGSLTFDSVSDENDNEKSSGDDKTAFQMSYKETKDGNTTMSSDVHIPVPEIKQFEQKECGTDAISLRDKCTLTNQNKVSSRASMTDSIDIQQFNMGKTTSTATGPEMIDKGQQAFTDVGSVSSGICVQCCQNLQSEINIASSNYDTAPAVQDIIIMNTVDQNNKEWRRRRRSMIRSRRVQTDLSMSNEEIDEKSLSVPNLNRIPERSISCDGILDMRKPDMRTVALDPIFPDDQHTRKGSVRRKTRDKDTMTSFEMKLVVPTRNAMTYTYPPRVRDFSAMAKADMCTAPTQTPSTVKFSKGIGTDYAGQCDKITSTVKISVVDCETSMPTMTSDSKSTWTDILQTSERAIITDGCETCETGTEMAVLAICDSACQVKPNQVNTTTSTEVIKQKHQNIQTVLESSDSHENRKSWHGGAGLFSKLFRGKGDKGSSEKINRSHPDLNEILPPPSPIKTDACTETCAVVLCDKETGTVSTVSCDQWTLTPTPVLINTGISPARPATMESAVETTPVSYMDQGTYTEVVTLKDTTTETIVSVQDNETLTESVKLIDAQTFVALTTENNETNTEQKTFTESYASTDENWLEKLKPESKTASTETTRPNLKNMSCNTLNVPSTTRSTNITTDEFVQRVDTSTNPIVPDTHDRGTMAMSFGQTSTMFSEIETQTSEIDLLDKSIATSMEIETEKNNVELCDMATSTESLPYIGLLSELDGDELFLIPESAFDMVSPEPSVDENGEHVEMVDDETSTDVELLSISEISTQTTGATVVQMGDDSYDAEVWSQNPRLDSAGKELIDVGTNTISKLTFEKETSTPIRHLFSKGTMTFYIAKTDKSTSTASNTRQIAENCFNSKPPADKAHKVTMTSKMDTAEVATSTDSSLVRDGRMAECISKLRNVSEKLQSPTSKTIPDVPWKITIDGDLTAEKIVYSPNVEPNSQNESSCVSESGTNDERIRNIQTLINQSQTIGKVQQPRRDGRKSQPITTLKGKMLSPPDDPNSKSRSLPRESTNSRDANGKSVGGVNVHSKLPRYNSAPGRIATVPTQSMRAKHAQVSQKLSPSRIPVHKLPDNPPEEPVQVVRPKSKPNPLPAINETRRPSVTSETGSTASHTSASSESSFASGAADKRADLNSLKITSTSKRESPVPFSVSEEEGKQARRSSPLDKKNQGNVGFMQKLFSKKKKLPESKPTPTPTTPKQPRQFQKPKPLPPEKKSPKPQRARPFVYVRQRIFSIQHDNEDSLKPRKDSLPEPPKDQIKPENAAPDEKQEESRPLSTYDNL